MKKVRAKVVESSKKGKWTGLFKKKHSFGLNFTRIQQLSRLLLHRFSFAGINFHIHTTKFRRKNTCENITNNNNSRANKQKMLENRIKKGAIHTFDAIFGIVAIDLFVIFALGHRLNVVHIETVQIHQRRNHGENFLSI